MARFKKQYNFYAVDYGPRTFIIYGAQVIQGTDIIIGIHDDKKLELLNCFAFDQYRRKTIDE